MIDNFVVDRQPIDRSNDDATNRGEVGTQVGNGGGELVVFVYLRTPIAIAGAAAEPSKGSRFDSFARFFAFGQQRIKKVEKHLFG